METADREQRLRLVFYRIAVFVSSAELPVFRDDYVPVERMIADLLLTTRGL